MRRTVAGLALRDLRAYGSMELVRAERRGRRSFELVFLLATWFVSVKSGQHRKREGEEAALQ